VARGGPWSRAWLAGRCSKRHHLTITVSHTAAVFHQRHGPSSVADGWHLTRVCGTPQVDGDFEGWAALLQHLHGLGESGPARGWGQGQGTCSCQPGLYLPPSQGCQPGRSRPASQGTCQPGRSQGTCTAWVGQGLPAWQASGSTFGAAQRLQQRAVAVHCLQQLHIVRPAGRHCGSHDSLIRRLELLVLSPPTPPRLSSPE
jgi:hypothetical protein